MFCIAVSRSCNLLLSKLGLVLIFNADVLEGCKLLLLNSFDLESFVFKLLSDFAAFFKVVQSGVLVVLGVSADLSADSGGVVAEVHLLLVLDDALLLLSTLLLLNDAEERVTLQLCLLGKHFFALISELNLVDVSFTFLMEHDNHTDNVKLLLVDSSLIEKSLFVELKHSLLKFNFLILDFLASFIKFR